MNQHNTELHKETVDEEFAGRPAGNWYNYNQKWLQVTAISWWPLWDLIITMQALYCRYSPSLQAKVTRRGLWDLLLLLFLFWPTCWWDPCSLWLLSPETTAGGPRWHPAQQMLFAEPVLQKCFICAILSCSSVDSSCKMPCIAVCSWQLVRAPSWVLL